MAVGPTEKPAVGDDSRQRHEAAERVARPLQFRLGSLLVLTAVVAALLGLLRWVGVPRAAVAVVLAVLAAGAIAALGLIAAVFATTGHGRSSRDQDEENQIPPGRVG